MGWSRSAARVQKVQKVQKVQRVVVAADAASFIKKGHGSAAGCVEGLWKKVLKVDRPLAGGFLSLTALQAEGCGGSLRAQIIKKGARLAPQVVSKGCVAFAQGATALRAEGDGGALRARILKKRGAPSVISAKAGQPPIGKPLIVQARGQLRLTWRLYAESPQSGEISLHHGTGSIGLGDLSTQSFIEAVPL